MLAVLPVEKRLSKAEERVVAGYLCREKETSATVSTVSSLEYPRGCGPIVRHYVRGEGIGGHFEQRIGNSDGAKGSLRMSGAQLIKETLLVRVDLLINRREDMRREDADAAAWRPQ